MNTIWIIDGRDTAAYRKHGKNKVKNRPWKAGEFDTSAEAEAFKKGVIAAIGGELKHVFFLPENEALEIDSRVVQELQVKYPHLNIKLIIANSQS